ncbi:hypothetical protein MM456_003081 [Salmonella enterica]|nr:hypothetical protein [Salmonella enterica]
MSNVTDSTPRSNKGDGDILEVRRQVISGDWSPINRGEYICVSFSTAVSRFR